MLLGLEVARQPLYPWDAWTQWATKARVWYELGRIVPFAGSDAWFAGDGAAYFDAAPGYPPTVPLLQAWTCLVLGRWDDALMNWPWWQIAVALALAVYGGLRSLRVSALAALVGTFFVASLPLANVHVALAGYADFPLAAYLHGGGARVPALARSPRPARRRPRVAAGHRVHADQESGHLLGADARSRRRRRAGATPRRDDSPRSASAARLLALVVLAQTSTTIFNYRLHLDFDPAWAALGESLFLLGNWHLLWYAALAIARARAPASSSRRRCCRSRFVIASGALFLFVALAFTNARAWVTDQSTVNRATLHFAPLLVVFVDARLPRVRRALGGGAPRPPRRRWHRRRRPDAARIAYRRRGSASRSASGAFCRNACTYAASRLRVCPGMSVSGDPASPVRIAARTSRMNAGSSASRTAMSTYSRPPCATVCVTPRLARIENDARSPWRLPTSVTTGTPMSSASSVPLTPPKGIGSSTKSMSS